jgi:hypothetical protein
MEGQLRSNLFTRLALMHLVAVSIALLPGLAAAIVVEGAVISGLPPDTVIVLHFAGGETSTATTDTNGEITVSDEEDDDLGTLYIPPGEESIRELRTEAGLVLGTLRLSGTTVTAVSSVSSLPAIEDRPRVAWFIELGGDVLAIDDLRNNTRNGAALAEADGFSVTTSADDVTFGPQIVGGVIFGAGREHRSRGSWQGEFAVSYSQYDDMQGEFTASQAGVTIRSAGQSEIQTWGLNAGARYFIADRVGLYGGIGYRNFSLDDSGRVVWLETDMELSAFNESRHDDVVAALFGLSYHFNSAFSIDALYQRFFGEIGASETDDVHSLALHARYNFNL